jgi:hypothetical protein
MLCLLVDTIGVLMSTQLLMSQHMLLNRLPVHVRCLGVWYASTIEIHVVLKS